MSYLRKKVIEEYIEENCPNARIVDYDDPNSGLTFYTSEELQKVEADWFPLCCYRDSQSGKLLYGGRSKVYHTYLEGETGAGKTSRFVIQSIRALSSLKNKPSFLVADIHGEITENLYEHLKKNGYDIKILNCDEPERSDTYNPLETLARECLRTGTISNETQTSIRRIAEILQPVESTSDPIWDKGARAYTNGAILDKFEDLIAGNLPLESLNLYNVIQNHFWLRAKLDSIFEYGGIQDLCRIPHYKEKGASALSVQKMVGITNNAEKTRSSYFGVVESHYDTFGQSSLYLLSSNSTIDLESFLERPTFIVIQSGCTSIGDDLISLLVNDIYTMAVHKGKDNPTKRLPRNVHCFLDEFANCNIADGKGYTKMLTTSRKFGMYWHMILQSDAQLDMKFHDPLVGRTIRSNASEIFMGSNDYETQVRFAGSCGRKTVESLESRILQQAPGLSFVDIMTPDRLNLMEEGCAYVKMTRHSLLRTYFEPFYTCDEFVPLEDIDSIYPVNDFDYKKTVFTPDDIPDYRRKRAAASAENVSVLGVRSDRNRLITALEKHLKISSCDYVLSCLEGLTMVPECLKDAIRRIGAGESLLDTLELDAPLFRATLMKFEILEAYIDKNNFKTKAKWEEAMEAELNTLTIHDWLPDELTEIFHTAYMELKDSLTLSNIKEIKKILNS